MKRAVQPVERAKAEPYRADNRPVGSPAWSQELASWLALIRERPVAFYLWDAMLSAKERRAAAVSGALSTARWDSGQEPTGR